MSQVKVQDQVKVQENSATRRKMIQKVRRKVKRENQRIASAYSQFVKDPKSGIGSFYNNNQDNGELQMTNQIGTGQNRRLKKKMKKLKKVNPQNPDKVFKQIQKYKQGLYEHHKKKLFSSVKQLQKRREKRKEKIEQNSKKRKAQIMQKNLDRFD